jgi:hypothetical protein
LISRIYDQSGKGNHFYQAPPGRFKGPAKGAFNHLPIADMAPITISGHKVYGVFIMPGMGFRNNDATGIAINDEPEGIYYVVDGTHYDSGCCFDYGNSSTNGRAVGTGTMETTYFGTATAWGSGDGPGPWIMADFEAGLFSGYNPKKNAGSPTINSWRFVTAVVDGGGGNKWDLRGGDAQRGPLATFYSGVRPGTPGSDAYFPMHKQGAILLGNGGDNGNGSAGTFYEGVMTTGYPSEATTDAVQANIVAAKYDVQRVSLSRVTTFTPGSTQDATVRFTNTSGAPAQRVTLSVSLPGGWKASLVSGSDAAAGAVITQQTKTFAEPVVPGASVGATFRVTAPATPGAGYLSGNAEWAGPTGSALQSENTLQRLRNAFPIKINEIGLTRQFIELYNASASEVDISNWTLVNTRSEWAPVKLATIPSGTTIAAKGYYLLALAGTGLAAPAQKGDSLLNVVNVDGLTAGQEIHIEGETRRIARVGTAATAMTTVFIPVSTGPWLKVAAGSNNLPVASAAGFEVGQKVGIDVGGSFELATITAVGEAGTQTTLSAAAKAGATRLKVSSNANMTVRDTLTVGAGDRKEIVTLKTIDSVSNAAPGPSGGGAGGRNEAAGGEIELATPLKFDHMAWEDVSDAGTGISFSPATRFPHTSGDAVQALGSGIALDRPLDNPHDHGAAVVSAQAPATTGYQGMPAPHQWFGSELSRGAGSVALVDSSGTVIVDAVVYGSQQSSSSANGTVASPELATLEGVQDKGGCIVVVPQPARGGRGRGAPAAAAPGPGRSAARTADGADTDSNCTDFQMQSATPGAPNQGRP